MIETEFHLQLARELGGINQSLKNMCIDIKEMKTHLETQNGRIRKNEDDINGIKVKATLIAGGVGTAVMFAWDFIKIKILQ